MTNDFNALLNTFENPCVIVGPDTKMIAMNDRASEMIGFDALDLPFVTVFRAPEIGTCVENVLSSRKEQITHHTLYRQGLMDSYRLNCRPIELDSQLSAILFFENISEQKRVEQMRKDFVANVSHELRTPLAALSGFVETLQTHGQRDPKAAEHFLSLMAGEARHMTKLVQDLLELSQVEADERRRLIDQVDLCTLWPKIKERFLNQANAQSCVISYQSRVPQAYVLGQEDKLLQIISNLVENALKYGADEGKIDITLYEPKEDRYLRTDAYCLEIRDFGMGIDSVHLPRLTERFYRVDDHRSRALGGTGLGLAIVKHIVSRHQGRFEITSEAGQGTLCQVYLPKSNDSI